MFLKFICKAFFCKKHCKIGKKRQNKWPKRYFKAFFPGIVRPFGKTGSHFRESWATLRAQIRRAKTIFYGGRIRWNGTVGTRRGTANKKQKLPHKKRTAPFPERYTIRSGKWGWFTFPELPLFGPCCSTRSHAVDKKEKLPSIPLWSCRISTRTNSGIF